MLAAAWQNTVHMSRPFTDWAADEAVMVPMASLAGAEHVHDTSPVHLPQTHSVLSVCSNSHRALSSIKVQTHKKHSMRLGQVYW